MRPSKALHARVCVAVCFALAAGAVSGPADAQSADRKEPKQVQPVPAKKPPTTKAALPEPAAASALAREAQEIASSLGNVTAGTLVVASPVTSDLPATKGSELAVRFASLVAGALGTARAYGQPKVLGAARLLAGRSGSLVYLQLEIVKGDFRVTADLYTALSNSWERVRNPVSNGPRAHAFVRAPIDAEIRGFLEPVLLEKALLHKAKHGLGDVLAVGCGDVDEDGGLELVLVAQTEVATLKLRAGKVVVSHTAAWSTLLSRAPIPMREPLASVLVAPRGHRSEILMGTTDRGSVAVDAALVVRRPLAGLPVPGANGDACVIGSPELGSFEGPAVPCDAGRGQREVARLAFAPPVARYDAIATFDAIASDGSVSHVIATREPSGRLGLRWDAQDGVTIASARMEATGAQVALADLDLDGQPEVITTGFDGSDVVLVATLTRSGELLPRLRFEAPEGVRALAICPPEDKGVPSLAAVVGSEVWLVR